MEKIELLAPAGDYEVFQTAVLAGADAVYLAGKNFGARAFSTNFTIEEIINAVKYAHLRKVKVYVTVNTIVYENEWEDLKAYIGELYHANVDALIVQDLGIIEYISEKYPGFEIHASTQMNIYDKEASLLLKKIGIKRVVLARETSLEQVKAIAKTGIEIEVFAHGALCYCASGNCLMSFAIGKRSGNRGTCAQPCRKKYCLVENNLKISEDCSLLSMRDLNTINYIDQLIEANVASLKIEGRMKSKEYVYAVVKNYRKRIDDYYNNKKNVIDEKVIDELSVAFNRKFTKGYLFNENNNLLTNIQTVNHQGIVIGKVINVVGNSFDVKLSKELLLKDAIRVVGKSDYGFVVNKMLVNHKEVNYAKPNEVVRLTANAKITKDSIVLKTQSAQLQTETVRLLNNPKKYIEINAKLTIKYANKMQLTIFNKQNSVTVETITLEMIAEKPVSLDFIKERFDKFKDTPFYLNKLIIDYDDKCYFSVKDLNEIRKLAINKFTDEVLKYQRVNSKIVLPDSHNFEKEDLTIEIIVNNKDQYNICKELGFNNIYTDYNSDMKNLSRLNYNANEFGLINNLSQINNGTTTSIYFNIVNKKAVSFLNRFNVRTVYLSNELNYEQLKSMLPIYNMNIGVQIYGRYDLMISKHCFVSKIKGASDKNCHKCLNNHYEIIDEYNNHFPVILNPNDLCSLRIVNNKVLNNLNMIEKYISLGINHFMIIFTTETKEEITEVLKKVKFR